jgi:hypothetical protein
MHYYSICRFCHKASYETPDAGMVRYSIRHWAHWHCGLAHFGIPEFWAKLTDSQRATVPSRMVDASPELRKCVQEWAR